MKRLIKKTLFFFCSLCAASSFLSCKNIFQEEEYSLSCPEDGRIYYIKNFALESRHCSASERLIFKDKEIFAVYFLPDTISYLPGLNTIGEVTGCLFPIEKDLSLAGGFTAQVFIRLILQSHTDNKDTYDYVKKFNWKRFFEKIKEYENPYEIDMDKIVTDIAGKNFSLWSIKKI